MSNGPTLAINTHHQLHRRFLIYVGGWNAALKLAADTSARMTVQVIATGAVSFMVVPVQAQLPERAKANQRQMALNAKARMPPANKPHVITDKTRNNKAYVMLKNVEVE